MESAEKNPPATMTIETRGLPDVYDPQAAWYRYRDCIYGSTAGTLTPKQEKECSNAFYRFSEHDYKFEWPVNFTKDELKEPWIRVMYAYEACRFNFSRYTPTRFFRPRTISLPETKEKY